HDDFGCVETARSEVGNLRQGAREARQLNRPGKSVGSETLSAPHDDVDRRAVRPHSLTLHLLLSGRVPILFPAAGAWTPTQDSLIDCYESLAAPRRHNENEDRLDPFLCRLRCLFRTPAR